MISKKDVPLYDPLIRRPYIFNKSEKLKKFILSKLINAEYASLRAPAFSVYSEKTLESSLQRLCDSLLQSTRSFVSFPGSAAGDSTIGSTTTSLSPSTSSHGLDSASIAAAAATAQSTTTTTSTTNINNSSSSGIKGALKKVFRTDNNPYIAPDVSRTPGRKMSTPMTPAEHHYHQLFVSHQLRNNNDEDEELSSKSKEKIAAQKQVKRILI